MADKTTIPADDALAALTDDQLLDLATEHEIDASAFDSRESAIDALKAARDAAPLSGNNPKSESADDHPSTDAPADDQADVASEDATDPTPTVINTEADVENAEDASHDDAAAEIPASPKLSALLATEVKAAHARGDHSLHAALHNFEAALADFRRAAAALETVIDTATPIGAFARAVRES